MRLGCVVEFGGDVGGFGVGVEGHRRGQQGASGLAHLDVADRHGPPVAGAVDDDVQGRVAIAGTQERGVDRMGAGPDDGGRCRCHRLGDQLAAEDPPEAAGLVVGPESVGAGGLWRQHVLQPVECVQRRGFQRAAGIAQRSGEVGGADCDLTGGHGPPRLTTGEPAV